MVYVGAEHDRFSAKRSSSPRVLHHYFERQAALHPERLAIECCGEQLSYDELNRYANQIAHALELAGVTTGSLVGILLDKSPRLYAAMLGVLKAGAGYVPLDPKFPADRITGILADCQAAAVVTAAVHAATLASSVDAPLVLLDADQEWIGELPDMPLSTRQLGLRAQDPCYVIYTSGSTGRPKGVLVEHRNAEAFVEGMLEAYEVNGPQRVYQGFSVAFDASIEEIWLAFALGGTLVVPSQDIARSPGDAADFINANRISYFSTIPTFLSMIQQDLPTVTTLVLGGEACSPELVTRWARPGRRVLNTYGPTETTVVATLAELVPGETVTIGRPLPGYRTHVFDEEMQPVPPGGTGELYIGGRAVTRGYMNSPQMTDERYVQNPLNPEKDRLYRTGDQVRVLPSGELEFIGRIDGQIKMRGFRVELSEIEAVLQQQAGIQAAGVSVINSAQGMELAAFVVCEDGIEIVHETIAAELRRLLPEYMVPKYLDVVAALPLSNSGKIDRKALPEPTTLLRRNASADRADPPADDLERHIAEIWQRTLNVADISATDDFFIDLGGHSLLAAQTVTELRKSFGHAAISVRDLYRYPSVRALADVVRTREPSIGPGASTSKSDGPTPSEATFASVGRATRTVVSLLQGLSVTVYYSLASAPIAFGVLLVAGVLEGRIAWPDAAWLSTVFGFAYWPSMLLFSVALKWLVIGRYKPGRYPVWGFYYFRWWLVTRFQALAWAEMFSGTPLMNLYYRAMGAKVGRRVSLSTPHCMAFDVVSIGDDSSVGLETQMLGYRVEDGMLIIAPVEIGRDCFVGMHCNLGLGTSMQDGSRLDDMSLLADGAELGPGEMRRGAPAVPVDVRVPGDGLVKRQSKLRRFVFGLLHLFLIYVMGYFLLASVTPGMVLIVAALYFAGPVYAIAAALLSVPLSIGLYLLGVIAVKRLLIGPLEVGTVPLYTGTYLRHWFAAYLMENTRHILMPLYATVYLPAFLRQLGAKIGAGSEVSTVAHICPDHLEVGDGSFLADACLIGGHRIHGGFMQTGPAHIGAKSFIGNSALLPPSSIVGDEVLIGVASTPPIGNVAPHQSAWLGSPAFELPRRQQDCCFSDATTFNPTQSMKRQRALIDAARLVSPGLIMMVNAILFAVGLVIAWHNLPLWGTILAIPALSAALSFNAILIVALIKKACIGALEPTVRPLWSRFVWLNEFVNALYEGVVATAMTPLLGTRMAAPALRMMGCKVGYWVFLDTTLFSEFDLVHIDDHAALNIGATIQTHLFEDRVFKADVLHIGRGCAVGNMAIVLYGTQMHPGARLDALSVLMKGETLPPETVWRGIPCEQVVSAQTAGAQAEAQKASVLERDARDDLAVTHVGAVDVLGDVESVVEAEIELEVVDDDRGADIPVPVVDAALARDTIAVG